MWCGSTIFNMHKADMAVCFTYNIHFNVICTQFCGAPTTFNEKMHEIHAETGSLIDSWDPKCSAEIYHRW